MTVSCARVSSVDQDFEHQIRKQRKRGCEKIFTEPLPRAREAPAAARRGLCLPFIRRSKAAAVQFLPEIRNYRSTG